MAGMDERFAPFSRAYFLLNHFISIFTSSPFKFLIDGNALYIHRGLITRNSAPLDRMVNGHMSEAVNGYAAINGLGDGVFARFICWAYTGSYSAAEFTEDRDDSRVHQLENADPPPKVVEHAFENGEPSSENAEHLLEVVVRDGFGGASVAPVSDPYAGRVSPPADEWGVPQGLRSSKKKTKKKGYDDSESWGMVKQEQSTKASLKVSFIRRNYPVQDTSFTACAPRANTGPHENYMNVFLSHARIYVFAEKYDIKPLQVLALQNLHQTLSIYTLHHERVGDITALLQYSYENTAETDNGDEGLRALLMHYVQYEMDVLVKSWKFKDLLLSDGEILGDFLKMVAKRI